MNVEREKQQIGDELKSVILSMEDVQSAQQNESRAAGTTGYKANLS